jgi:hypothetical protein
MKRSALTIHYLPEREMTDIKAEQLALCEEILSLIDAKRQKTGDPMLGAAIERFVLQSQFRELEEDIFQDPGAFEPWLIRPRRS